VQYWRRCLHWPRRLVAGSVGRYVLGRSGVDLGRCGVRRGPFGSSFDGSICVAGVVPRLCLVPWAARVGRAWSCSLRVGRGWCILSHTPYRLPVARCLACGPAWYSTHGAYGACCCSVVVWRVGQCFLGARVVRLLAISGRGFPVVPSLVPFGPLPLTPYMVNKM
jgi:hypothetical protein